MTLWLPKEAVKNPETGGDQPSAREALPLALTRARGGRDHPMLCPFRLKKPTRGSPLRLESLLGLLEKVCGRKTERNGEKQNKAQEAKKHPCRLASEKQASEKSRENPKKRPGPRMAPRQNARKKGRTAKTGDKPGCGGDTKRKGQKTQSACGGVPCDYLIYLSEKRKRKKKQTKRRHRRKTKEERKKTRNTRPDIKRIFLRQFQGAETRIIKQKHRQNNTKQHTTNTDTQKQKFAPEVFFKKRPLDKKNAKKNDKRHRARHKKHKMKKTDSISPFEKGENATR